MLSERLSGHGVTPSIAAPSIAILGGALLLTLLSACSDEAKEIPVDPSRPVKLFQVDDKLGEEVRRFPATIDASQKAEMSFRVSGRLLELPILEGEVVDEGQVIARLDPTDYQNALEDRQATFDNATSNFERAKELVADGNISRVDYDRMEAESRSSRAALRQAQTNLGYTTLTAPFGGRIARRDVENFEDVNAKQSIAFLQDLEQLFVIIAMSESVVRSLQRMPPDEISSTSVVDSRVADTSALVSFGDRTGISYALSLSEISTRADPDTQTYRVTFTMPQPDEFAVLPGMTAEVELDFTPFMARRTATWVPTQAVQANAELQSMVWVLDEDSMTVDGRDVEIGRVSGTMVQVLSGLDGGEEIVAAGAAYLLQGMPVTRLLTTEQAAPRTDEGVNVQ